MSVFDLFRGFFGLPGGHYRGDGRREPFFDGMTHDEDDDDDEDAVFYYDGFDRSGEKELLDEAFRFGFSLGPNGMRIHEPPVFGQMFREMEEILDSLGRVDQGFPSIQAPSQEGAEDQRRAGVEGNEKTLRDFMLKAPDNPPCSPPSVGPEDGNSSLSDTPSIPRSPFFWSPFSKFKDIWSDGPRWMDEEKKEDGDLDSQVSSGGLDQILTPAPSHPKTRSYFKSVTVTKVVKPDGSVEERRTVRDGQGNEETTVTRSGPGVQEGPQDQPGPLIPGGSKLFSDMQDESSMFKRFFGGFKE
ncbi:HCLS1-associated protein X-1 isoform X2 [Salminus brasiliensis]|uniref:HCLS1-associated protein X-1 isoform X2 n=1 Tax=Salminus brasiliensis TaxID=930266 RepID=UPI003B834A59